MAPRKPPKPIDPTKYGGAQTTIKASGGGKIDPTKYKSGQGGKVPVAVTVPDEHKAPSLLGQVKNAVTALPSGLAHMAAQGGRSIPGAIKDVVTLEAPRAAVSAAVHGHNPAAAFSGSLSHNVPIYEDFRASAARTGGRVTDLGSVPFGKQGLDKTKYAQASREGNIVGAILEDTANLSMGAAGAGKIAGLLGAAGVPGAEAVAQGLRTASTLGGQVAGGPAKAFTLPFTVAEKLGAPSLGEAGAAAGEALAHKFPTVGARFPSLTPQGREGLALLEEGRANAAQAAAGPRRAFQRAEKATPDIAEQHAATAIRLGQADVLAKIPDAPPELLAKWTTGVTDPESRFAIRPDAAKIAQEYAAGTLDPVVKARIEAGIAEMSPISAGRQEGALARGSIGQEQLGYEPLPVAGTKALEDAGVNPKVSVDVAPSRLRPVMATGQRIRKDMFDMAQDATLDPALRSMAVDLADEIPHTLDQLEAAGIDAEHLIGGGRDPLTGGTALGIPRRVVPLSETMQRETTLQQYGFREQAQLEARRAVQVVRDDTAQKFEQTFGADPATVLGRDTSLLSPQRIAMEMQKEGYSPLGRGMEGTLVDKDTVFVPSFLKDAFDKEFHYDPASRGLGWRALSRGNRAWKSWVLPLSPRWHIGNVVGNVLMATVGGGVNPFELVRNLKAARDLWKAGDEHVIPPRLFESSVMQGEMRALFGDVGLEAQSKMATLLSKSYELNTFVDNMFRSAVYLSKIGKGLTPEVAVREALKAMGDFTNMKPWERAYAREVLPFYSWTRHITGLTLRLPIEHPVRVAWTLHLADMYGDDQSQLPDFLKGSVKFGDQFLPSQSLNPFGDVGRSPFLTPSGLGAATSPFIKVPIQMATGVDLSHGFNQTTRPAGVGKTDDRGGYRAGPLPIGELPGLAINQVPLWRMARDVVQGAGARYGTGEPIQHNGERLGGGAPAWQTVLRGLVPFPKRYTQEDINSAMRNK